MFDYLTKTSIINLKELILESINYPGWQSNLFLRLPVLFGCGWAKTWATTKEVSSSPNVQH